MGNLCSYQPYLNLISALHPSQPSLPVSRSYCHFWRDQSLIVIFTLMFFIPAVGFAQNSAQSLAERSSIIVRGKIMKINASDEPMVEPSSKTAVVSVQEMLAGKEIAGNLSGRTITVILSREEGLKEGAEATFFGNVRFFGQSLTIADEGELPAAAADSASSVAQASNSKPLADRMAVATLVFRGTVKAIRPLGTAAGETQGKRSARESSEHDPQWQAATVQVATALRGGTPGQTVTVVFAASRDITWFNSPKLKTGQDAIFIAHAPTKEEEPLYRGSNLAQFVEKQPSIYLVTEPLDVLPAADEDRVRSLLASMKEVK